MAVSQTYSLYGASGTIGSYLNALYPNNTDPLERNDLYPAVDRHGDGHSVIYLISTNTNSIADQSDIQNNINTNLTILLDRLEACRETGVKEFNFISSWFVYGKPTFNTSTYSNGVTHIPVFKESDYCDPVGYYSITKRTAEQFVIEFCETHGIKWRILRLSNVYGYDPGANKNKNVLHYLINQLKENSPTVEIQGCLMPPYRDYIHIYDACRAIMHLCNNAPPNNIYNVGRGPTQAMSLHTAIGHAKEYCNSQSQIHFVKIADNCHRYHINAASLSIDKLITTGFKPQVPFLLGLKELCIGQRSSIADHISEMKKLTQQLST